VARFLAGSNVMIGKAQARGLHRSPGIVEPVAARAIRASGAAWSMSRSAWTAPFHEVRLLLLHGGQLFAALRTWSLGKAAIFFAWPDLIVKLFELVLLFLGRDRRLRCRPTGVS